MQQQTRELSQTSNNTYRSVVASLPALGGRWNAPITAGVHTPNPRRFELRSSVQPPAERSSARHASGSASGNIPGSSSTNMTQTDEKVENDDDEGFTTYRSSRRRLKPAIVGTWAVGKLNFE